MLHRALLHQGSDWAGSRAFVVFVWAHVYARQVLATESKEVHFLDIAGNQEAASAITRTGQRSKILESRLSRTIEDLLKVKVLSFTNHTEFHLNNSQTLKLRPCIAHT